MNEELVTTMEEGAVEVINTLPEATKKSSSAKWIGIGLAGGLFTGIVGAILIPKGLKKIFKKKALEKTTEEEIDDTPDTEEDEDDQK